MHVKRHMRDILFLLIQLELLYDLLHLLFADVIPDAVHGGVPAQLFQIAAGVTFCLLRYLLQVDRVAQLRRQKSNPSFGCH